MLQVIAPMMLDRVTGGVRIASGASTDDPNQTLLQGVLQLKSALASAEAAVQGRAASAQSLQQMMGMMTQNKTGQTG